MKLTLLEMVQEILPDIDGDEVNSIGDTEEATQIAGIIRQTYFNLVAERVLPEHKELTTLDSIADSTRPCYLKLPEDVDQIYRVEYNVADTDGEWSFRHIEWKEPLEFLDLIKTRDLNDSNTTSMLDINGLTTIIIRSNKHPTFYTSFDDEHLVFDSYKSTVDTTLNASKTRAYVSKEPQFTLEDSFTPDLNNKKFRLLVNEAKSLVMATIPKTVNPVVERNARKQRTRTQDDTRRTDKLRSYNGGFGRT